MSMVDCGAGGAPNEASADNGQEYSPASKKRKAITELRFKTQESESEMRTSKRYLAPFSQQRTKEVVSAFLL